MMTKRRSSQREWTGSPDVGLVRFVRALVVASCLVAVSCAQQPEQFVQRFDEALASGDAAAVAQMLTPTSRSLYMAMQQIEPAAPPDPATAVVSTVGHAGFVPSAPVVPTRLVAVQKDATGVIFRVEADGQEREWVMQMSGNVWQLDLVATSSRSSWLGM